MRCTMYNIFDRLLAPSPPSHAVAASIHQSLRVTSFISRCSTGHQRDCTMSSSNESHAFAGEVITLSIGPAANDISALYFNRQVTQCLTCTLCSIFDARSDSHAHRSCPVLVLCQWDDVRDTLPASASTAAETSTRSTIDWRTLFRTVTSTTSSTPHFIPRLVALSLPSQTGYYPGIGDVLDYSGLLSSANTSGPLSAATSQWTGRTQLQADPDDIAALQQNQQRSGRNSTSVAGSECWTDWLRLERLHDKNVYRLKPLQNEDDAFEYFTVGHETIRQQHGVTQQNTNNTAGNGMRWAVGT